LIIGPCSTGDLENRRAEGRMTLPLNPQWTRRRFTRAALAAGLASAAPRALPALPIWPLKKKDKRPPAPEPTRVTGPESLRAHAAARGLLYGAAVVPELLDVEGMATQGTTDGYTQLVGAQAGILVAENAMKWHALRPTPQSFDFSQADRLMRFADLMGQRVRGHNLCWHEGQPSWFKSTATRENARQLLVDHIQSVCTHFRGHIQSWDVVNEAIDPADGRPDGLRKSPWLELVGPDYLELAFLTAAQADPAARLVYNDYGIELDTPENEIKRGQVMLLLRRLKARGVPIHAVGVQSHLQATGPQPGAGLVTFIRDAARLGLDVYITEMDVNTRKLEGGPAIQDTVVAKVYADYLGMVLREPNVPVALTWGLTDAHSWLNTVDQPWVKRADGAPQRPLPFDDALNPTPAFYALRTAIDHAHISQPQPAAAPAPTAAPAANPASEPNPDPNADPNPNDLYKPFPVQGSPTTKPTAPQPHK
jgi:endo-1,4-beta-xylanase